MGEAVVREEELLNDIREIFEHSSGQLSVFNVTSRLKKKYHIGRTRNWKESSWTIGSGHGHTVDTIPPPQCPSR